MTTDSHFASRKFVIACVIVVIATGFRIADLLSSAEWMNTVTWICGLYMAGNVGTAAVVAAEAKK